MKGLIGKKIGMTTIFTEDGNAHAATVIEVLPNLIFGHRTQERDGYTALQIATFELNEKQVKQAAKPSLGEYKKKNLKPHKTIREFRVDAKELAEHAQGSTLTVELFKKGDFVDVSGTSRGFGFSGIFKRHHMKGAARDSSTAHEVHRHIGAVGQRKTPGRIYLNKRLPGQMGGEECTIQDLAVLDVLPESNLLVIKGAIPGHRKGLVTVYPTVK